MIYIKYTLLAILQFVITLIVYPLTPFVVLFCNKEGNLPRWLSLFQTYDNTCDGDSGFIEEHRFFPANANAFQVWANRTGWLWRNPAYGFDMLIGLTCQPGDMLVISGDRKTSDGPYHPGVCQWKLYRDGKLVGFQWYLVRHFSATQCFRVNLGWKLWAAEASTKKGIITQKTTCQLVFTPGFKKKR